MSRYVQTLIIGFTGTLIIGFTGTLIIGFTGTSKGMSMRQRTAFILLVRALVRAFPKAEYHHGMCVGSDEDAHKLIRRYAPRAKIIGHPGINAEGKPVKRANVICDGLRSAHPYLVRNGHIVDGCDLLIATPETCGEELRSGTWSTVRRARKTRPVTPTIILEP